MNPEPQAIETHWRGYRFRSRLEARWAIFFTELGIEFHYEPEGFMIGLTPYLPDFWLPQVKMYAEVKPVEFTEPERVLAAGLKFPCLMLIGPPAPPLFYEEAGKNDFGFCDWYCIDNSYLDEHRFFNYGCETSHEDLKDYSISADAKRAIEVSRAARFEHGETTA